MLLPTLASAQPISVDDVTRQIEAGMSERRAADPSFHQHREQLYQQQDQHREHMRELQNIQTQTQIQDSKIPSYEWQRRGTLRRAA